MYTLGVYKESIMPSVTVYIKNKYKTFWLAYKGKSDLVNEAIERKIKEQETKK